MALERSIPSHHIVLVRLLSTVITSPLAVECLKWFSDWKWTEKNYQTHSILTTTQTIWYSLKLWDLLKYTHKMNWSTILLICITHKKQRTAFFLNEIGENDIVSRNSECARIPQTKQVIDVSILTQNEWIIDNKVVHYGNHLFLPCLISSMEF